MLAPLLASALADSARSGATPTASKVPSGALAARAQTALQAAQQTYGTRQTTPPASTNSAPGSARPPGSAQSTGAMTGAAAAAAKAAQLYQSHTATAYYNIDSQLAVYLDALAGYHDLDVAAVKRLLGELNAALEALGPEAYTPAGQKRVHDLVTIALVAGDNIVTGGHASASDIAGAIDQLTALFLYNIAGKRHDGVTLPNAPAAALRQAGYTQPGTPAAVQQAISTALLQQGKPYGWGDTGPDSFDCSGLMQYAAASAGISIPRTSQEQYAQLPAVNPADIRPGDLIFLEFGADGPGHVMMYLGNGQCVEAPHTGAYVRVTSLPDSFEARRLP
ncbi:NlpC/P60 family protein [Nocardia sp. NPDC046763]|uniref:NlpC/P60 family protein n=1 Tax=Nocardia sp. NPDC046763 TaxID=3155256 RepID=UPI0033EFF3A7